MSGMNDLFLKRVLFEGIRGSLERTDACLDIFTGKHVVMTLTHCFFNKSLCSFFTNPYARVYTISKKISHGAFNGENSPTPHIISVHPRSLTDQIKCPILK